jgi:serine/threonine protein kinase
LLELVPGRPTPKGARYDLPEVHSAQRRRFLSSFLACFRARSAISGNVDPRETDADTDHCVRASLALREGDEQTTEGTRGTAHRGCANRSASRGERDPRRAVPDVVSGDQPAVLRRLIGNSRHSRGGGVGPVVFLTMELLNGETLAERLRRDGRFTTTDSLPILRQMAAGLSAAHRAGVVHRDFKSHNVMLVTPAPHEQELRVVVTDFGLARRTAQDDHTGMSLSLNDASEVSGTPAYMAPEQSRVGRSRPRRMYTPLGWCCTKW